MSFFLVYSKSIYLHGSEYHRGIYTTLSDAKKRQSEICGENYTDSINGVKHGNGQTVFINVLPQGDCNIQTYTTSPSITES